MKLTNKLILCAMLGFSSLVVPAHASTVVETKCTSVADPKGCLFTGNINGNANEKKSSYISAQNAYNRYNDSFLPAGPDIFLNYIGGSDSQSFGTFTGLGGLGGAWTLNDGFVANFFAVKSSNRFILYQINPASSGTWSTTGLVNRNAKQQELSHLMFFGSFSPVSAVPEPSTWFMMLLGMGLIGSALRRRKAAVLRVA